MSKEPMWGDVKSWAQGQVKAARDSLEQNQGREEYQRGRISALRDLLALSAGEKSPAIPDSPDYHA